MAFYQQLAGSPNIVRSDQIRTDATHLSQLSMIWHDSPADEHPPADVTTGQDTIWRAVDAIVTAGHWQDTVFLLSGTTGVASTTTSPPPTSSTPPTGCSSPTGPGCRC